MHSLSKRLFRVLAIETSCDDTAVAIVTSSRQILSNVILAQHSQHQPHGGIVPKLAAQLHRQRLPAAIQRCIRGAGLPRGLEDIDAIAATRGPGLGHCLSVGFEAGRCIAAATGIPFFPIHHMEGHALTARLGNPQLTLPFLALLISGGHTLLLVVRAPSDYTVLGRSLDDSIGEALDKATRMLSLPSLPGESPAASLEKAALEGKVLSDGFTLPMKGDTSLDFSFSGLKTALKYRLEARRPEDDTESLAREFQRVATAHLEDRLKRALDLVQDIPRVVISGGVAKNAYIRERVTNLLTGHGKEVFFAPYELCSDNAVMIAWAAIEGINAGSKPLAPTDHAEVRPDWPLDQLKLL